MVQMLLRDVGIVPNDLHLESACLVVLQPDDLNTGDALERMEDGALAQPVDGVRPLGTLTHVDGVVIAVGVAEPQHHAARNIAAERVDQLLLHEAHRRGTQDDHTLIVQADDAEIRPEVQQFGELEMSDVLRLHDGVTAL
jgi:hypothetical protein